MRKKFTKVTNPATISQMTYSEDEQVCNQAESGLSWTPVGAINTAVKCEEASPVMLYNDSATTYFVKFGDSSVTAPTGAADGLPVPPKTPMIVNSGRNEYVIANNAAVFAYVCQSEN